MRDHAAAPSALQPTSPTAAELLLVDDDPVFGRVLTTALGRRGFQVTLAASVAQARELLPQLRVSHAVLDLRLPDGSGLELVPLLRERLPQVRIVVLSGYASIPTAIDAIKLGATYYLAKPVDADAVVRAFDAGDAASGNLAATGRAAFGAARGVGTHPARAQGLRRQRVGCRAGSAHAPADPAAQAGQAQRQPVIVWPWTARRRRWSDA